MPGISDLVGRNGVVEQLLLWNVVGQIVGTAGRPAFDQLTQDTYAAHPVSVLDPATLADLAARGIVTAGAATGDAARSGLSPARFGDLLTMATVRLQPADLATLVLRSYLSTGDAAAIAAPQGVDAAMLAALTYLAGDALGPDQLVQAVLRGLVPAAGSGPESVSYAQGIAESRLHDKWGPVLLALGQQLLSPPDAASAVVRNFLASDQATALAAKLGVDAATFETMVHLAADAPGPEQLAEALRRGAIPAAGTGPDSTSFAQGIAEGRLADKWAPVIQALAKDWPTPTDALNASVKGVFSAADGQAMYELLGGDPQFYDWLLYSIGNSPTPLEAAQMAYRGIIPWEGTGAGVTSYAQAVRESRYRDVWADAYKALSAPIPSPAQVVTLYSHRLLSQDDAEQLIAESGADQATVDAYIAEADYEAISDYRGLTQSSVIDMYVAHTITQDQATQLLEVLHVSASAAQLLLDYADMKYAIDSINKSVQRIATLYTGRKISTATAVDSLTKLGISVAAIDEIIGDWSLQAAASVTVLTYTQITSAFTSGILDQADAMDALEAIGYSPYDSWVILSTAAKAKLPGQPPRIVAAPPGAVIPGVT